MRKNIFTVFMRLFVIIRYTHLEYQHENYRGISGKAAVLDYIELNQ